jgi:hypothetical protein
MSRDGCRIAYLEKQFGVLNLMIRRIGASETAVCLTHDTNRSLMPALTWAGTCEHVVVFRDLSGEENYQAFSVSFRLFVSRVDGMREWK